MTKIKLPSTEDILKAIGDYEKVLLKLAPAAALTLLFIDFVWEEIKRLWR